MQERQEDELDLVRFETKIDRDYDFWKTLTTIRYLHEKQIYGTDHDRIQWLRDRLVYQLIRDIIAAFQPYVQADVISWIYEPGTEQIAIAYPSRDARIECRDWLDVTLRGINMDRNLVALVFPRPYRF